MSTKNGGDRPALTRARQLYEQAWLARKSALADVLSERAALDRTYGESEEAEESALAEVKKSGLEDLVLRSEALVRQARSALETVALGNVIAGSPFAHGMGTVADPAAVAKAVADAEVASAELEHGLLDYSAALVDRGQASSAKRLLTFLAAPTDGSESASDAGSRLAAVELSEALALATQAQPKAAVERLAAAFAVKPNLYGSPINQIVDLVVGSQDPAATQELILLARQNGMAGLLDLALDRLTVSLGNAHWRKLSQIDLEITEPVPAAPRELHITSFHVAGPTFFQELIATGFVVHWLLSPGYSQWGLFLVDSRSGEIVHKFSDWGSSGESPGKPTVAFENADTVSLNWTPNGSLRIRLHTGEASYGPARVDVRTSASEAALGNAMLPAARRLCPTAVGVGMDEAGTKLAIASLAKHGHKLSLVLAGRSGPEDPDGGDSPVPSP